VEILESCSVNPLISVVITNYNRFEDLQAGIRSVKEQDYPNVEIVVVDNASVDGSRCLLASVFPDVTVIPLETNVGMDGYSVGFHHCNGAFIFQMDNDSLMPDENVLSEIVKRFKEGPADLAAVATRVEEYNGDVGTVDTLRHLDERRGPINTGGFHAGGVGFRRSLLDKVGYYNPDVFLYGSELFLQMKFLAAGLRVCYYPEILMLHKSSGVARSSNGLYYEVRNRYWFMRYFATSKQQLWSLPIMILHDVVYSLYKNCPLAFVRALRDGFGPLPESLRSPFKSKNPDFIRKIDEVGFHFSCANLKKRMLSRLGMK
jgi:GT2 family glycosyltransferase